MTRRVIACVTGALVVLALGGCGGQKATVNGTAYLQRGVTYPAGSRLVVRLFDVTSGEVVSETREMLEAPTQTTERPSMAFDLASNASGIDPTHTYVVFGEVDQYGQVLAGTERVNVLTKASPSGGVDLHMAPLYSAGNGSRAVRQRRFGWMSP